jgi:hypothetical protein
MACCRSSTATVFGGLLLVLLFVDDVTDGGFPVVFLVVSDRFAILFSCRFFTADNMMSVTPLPPHTPLRPIDSCASLLCEMTAAAWLALQ